jgi:hypothetical protein
MQNPQGQIFLSVLMSDELIFHPYFRKGSWIQYPLRERFYKWIFQGLEASAVLCQDCSAERISKMFFTFPFFFSKEPRL